MTNLTEFLLARIAEDEAMARAAIQPGELCPWGDKRLPRRRPEDFSEDVMDYLGGTWGEHCAAWSPLRVLAECEAKREIIHMRQAMERRDGLWDRVILPSVSAALDLALMALAAPYADHSDYDQAWVSLRQPDPSPILTSTGNDPTPEVG